MDGPPHVLIARTIFGKGVSFMEGKIHWHYWPMSDEEYRPRARGGFGRGRDVRAAFARTLAELAERDERILLLTGDLGYKALEPFSERFPRRFFNVGVAEQNMVGLATGLAECGFLPFVYSIATFASLRAYEFIRNGPVAHRLKVRIVGVGGGFDYGSAGLTHHGLEDVGVLRLQPGLTVLAPADSEQTRSMLRDTYDRPGPLYYRLSKDDRLLVKELGGRFTLGRAEVLRRGTDVLLLVAGSLSSETLEASEALSKLGIEATVAVVSTLNPAPCDDLRGRLESFDHVVTVEDHYAAGGLGSIVAEIVAEGGIRCRLTRLGVKEGPDGRSGSHAYLLDRHGLSREAIVAAVKAARPHAEARRFMTGSLVSIVLPVHNQADHVVEVVREYEEGLTRLPVPYEIVLVVNGSTDSSLAVCRKMEERESTA